MLTILLPNQQPVLHSTNSAKVLQSCERQSKQQPSLAERNLSHGCPYREGDLVWLFNPVVSQGKSKKFHRPWTGPYTIVKQRSDSKYRIQHTKHRSKRCIVHFDRLKPCNGGNSLQCADSAEQSTPSPQLTQPLAPTLQIVSDGDSDNEDGDSIPAVGETRRYPSRSHHPLPALLTLFATELRTSSFKRGNNVTVDYHILYIVFYLVPVCGCTHA